jgi:hypothetical protein
MKTSTSPSYWVFLAYLGLTFYCLGAAVMNEFLEHQNWADLKPYLSTTDLAAWHLVTAQHTMPFLAVPLLLLTAVLGLLYWHLPPTVPRAALWLAMACHAAFWVSSVLMQWHLSGELSQTLLSPDPLDRLLHGDWLRKLLLFVETPVALYMAHRALRGSTGEQPANAAAPQPALQ